MISSYQKAGVNLLEAESFVKGVASIAAKTFDSNTLHSIGGFAGLYKLPAGYKSPVLVACTDGAGSKLKIAYENNKLNNIGQDLVAMCVNDLLCVGAKPLYFLDYLATENLQNKQALEIANSIAEACIECGATLLGGETAELPGMLPKNGYELAGFCTGIVEEEKILNPENTEAGDVLIALPSSGLHSNGYSLVRHIIEEKQLDLNESYDLESSLLEEILKPTKIYTKQVEAVLDSHPSVIKAVAHITGGGILENLPRSINQNLRAHIPKKSILDNINNGSHQSIFGFLQQNGNVSEEEMFKVFNMGIGLVLIVDQKQKEKVISTLKTNKQDCFELGYLENYLKDNLVEKEQPKNEDERKNKLENREEKVVFEDMPKVVSQKEALKEAAFS